MIRDITIGQYYKAKSVIHKLDPRLKLVCTLLFLMSLFLTRSVMTYLLATRSRNPVWRQRSIWRSA